MPCLNRASASLLFSPASPLPIPPPVCTTPEMPTTAAHPVKKPKVSSGGVSTSLAGNLSDHAVAEVLSWLPVTSLLRFVSVSPLWRDLISDPWFVNLHCSRGAARQLECLLAVRPFDHFARSLWLVQPGYCGKHSRRRVVDGPPRTWEIRASLEPTGDGADWQVPRLASCNGLMCSYEPRRVGVSNPVLGKTLWLPAAPEKSRGLLGFGFDPVTGEYKVIVQSSERKDQECLKISVCVLGYGGDGEKLAWKELSEGFPRLFEKPNPEPGFYFGGSLHWSGNARSRPSGRPLILSFDVQSESFRTWLGPKIDCLAPYGQCFLVLLGDTMGFVIQDLLRKGKGAEVWRLVDQVNEEWVKDGQAAGVLRKMRETYWTGNNHGLWVDSKSWRKGHNKMVYYDCNGRRFESIRLPLGLRSCPDRYVVHAASLVLPPDPDRCVAKKSLKRKRE